MPQTDKLRHASAMTPEQLRKGALLLAAAQRSWRDGALRPTMQADDWHAWCDANAAAIFAAARQAQDNAKDAALLDKLDALTGKPPDHPWDVTICGPGNHGGEAYKWLVTISDGNGDFHEWFGNDLRAAIAAATPDKGQT